LFYRINLSRLYHVDIARFAAKADHKWVDNLLSHFAVPGVERARQGLARRISADGIHHIALIRVITRDLGVSTGTALTLAERLLSENAAKVDVEPGLSLTLDRVSFVRRIDAAIADAVEAVEPARRGRPPTRPAAK
jgi:hypothetical protein